MTPGLTIKDRLRVLQTNDPDNYYGTRELVPHDMIEDIKLPASGCLASKP